MKFNSSCGAITFKTEKQLKKKPAKFDITDKYTTSRQRTEK